MTNLKQVSLTVLTCGALFTSAVSIAAPATTTMDTTNATTMNTAPSSMNGVNSDVADANLESGVFAAKINELNLTAEQQTKIQKIFKSYQQNFLDLKNQSIDAKHKLEAMTYGTGDTNEVKKYAEVIGTNLTKRIELRAKLRHEVYAELNKEQQGQVDSWSTDYKAHKAENLYP